MATVTKKDLIDRIAEKEGCKRVLVKRLIQDFLDSIIDELGKGNRLEFRDFGVFEGRIDTRIINANDGRDWCGNRATHLNVNTGENTIAAKCATKAPWRRVAASTGCYAFPSLVAEAIVDLAFLSVFADASRARPVASSTLVVES